MMNFKRLILILLVVLTLFLTVGAISAEDNVTSDSQNPAADEVMPVEDTASTQMNVTSSAPAEKIKTKVEADEVAVKYKKNSYFKVKIEDKHDDDIKIKNVNVQIKIDSGSKAKIIKTTTNSKGIVKINTKNLKIGAHKVVITSLDDKYKISKTSKIFVGKQYTATLKANSKKVLKNKDVIGLKIKKDDGEKEVKVVFKKKAKFTKIISAKFYLKNKHTGKIVVKTDKSEFENNKWDLPDEDFSNKYTLVKVKVNYISMK